jgi:hypothetical protein
MQNLLSPPNGKTQIEVSEKKVLRRIFGPKERGSKRRMEKITKETS